MLDFQLHPFAQVLRAFEQDFNQNKQTKAQSRWSLEEGADAFYLNLDTPGMKREDLDIEVIDRQLSVKWTIKGSERQIVAGTRGPTEYEHLFKLSDLVDIEDINAHYENGVLELRIGKRQSKASRKILISDSSLSGDNLKN